MQDLISRQAAIDIEGLDAQIRCEMCRNPMHTDRGCDGNCKYDEKLYERIMQILGERIKPLPSAQPDHIADGGKMDCISRQDAIDLVRDVCDAIMSGCESWYDPETEDEVYKDIREVDAILKCNKEIRIALRNMPSAQPELIRCKECINHGKEICYFWSHFYGTINTPDDGFCHKAERRTDERTDQ